MVERHSENLDISNGRRKDELSLASAPPESLVVSLCEFQQVGTRGMRPIIELPFLTEASISKSSVRPQLHSTFVRQLLIMGRNT